MRASYVGKPYLSGYCGNNTAIFEAFRLKKGNNITRSNPQGTVPEQLFEKKQLVPALQQMLISCSKLG